MLIFTILSIPLGQLGKLPGLPEGLNVYITDLLVGVTVGWWLLYSLLVKKSIKTDKTGAAIIVFGFTALISLIAGTRFLVSSDELLVSVSYLVRWFVYAGLYFVVLDSRLRGNDKLKGFLIFSGVLLALAGFLQLLFFPDWSQFSYLGWDPHKNRLLSTFFDPNFTGIYLVLIINLILLDVFYVRAKEQQRLSREPKHSGELSTPEYLRSKIILLLCLLFCSTALLLTFSRSAWLAMAVSIFVWGIFKWHKLLFGAVLVAFLAYFAVPRVQTRIAGGFDPDDSAKLRFQSWNQTWQIAKENLPLGVGFNTFRYVQAEKGYFDWRQPLGGHSGAGSDSSLLFVLATTGVFGFFTYLYILLSKSWEYFKSKLGGEKMTSRGVLIVSITAALLMNSLFINSLFYPAVMVFYWVILASEN